MIPVVPQPPATVPMDHGKITVAASSAGSELPGLIPGKDHESPREMEATGSFSSVVVRGNSCLGNATNGMLSEVGSSFASAGRESGEHAAVESPAFGADEPGYSSGIGPFPQTGGTEQDAFSSALLPTVREQQDRFMKALREWMERRDDMMRSTIEEVVNDCTASMLTLRAAGRKSRNLAQRGSQSEEKDVQVRKEGTDRGRSPERRSWGDTLIQRTSNLVNLASVKGKQVEFTPDADMDQGTGEAAVADSSRKETTRKSSNTSNTALKSALAVRETFVRFAEETSDISSETEITSDVFTIGGDDNVVKPHSALQKRLLRLYRGHWFEIFFGVMIISNAIFIGVEIDYTAANPLATDPPLFIVIGYLYTTVFAFELALKVSAERSKFICTGGKQLAWNMLDLLIVVSSMGEVLLDIIRFATVSMEKETNSNSGSVSMSNLRIIRIIRVTRLMRLFRIGRIVKFIRSLRLLVYSILSTLKTVFWAMLLLAIIIYVFAILFTQAVSDYKVALDVGLVDALMDEELHDVLTYHWGSLADSMLSLFMAISGGVSWLDVVMPIRKIGVLWLLVFLVYMTFTYFAVLNVVTGVFCQSAIESTQHDQDAMIQSFLANKTLHVNRFKSLFNTMDADQSGLISKDEFIRHIDDPQVQAYFASLELDSCDALNLFKLLESDDGCEEGIDIEDFVMGCLRLKGQAKSIDMARLMYESKLLSKDINDLVLFLQTQFQSLRGMKTVTTSEYQRHSIVAPSGPLIPTPKVTNGAGPA